MKLYKKSLTAVFSLAVLFGISINGASHSKASARSNVQNQNVTKTYSANSMANYYMNHHNRFKAVTHKAALPKYQSTQNDTANYYIYHHNHHNNWSNNSNIIRHHSPIHYNYAPVNNIKAITTSHASHKIHHIRQIHNNSWFVDGLDTPNLQARSWVSWHESRHEWKVLSYGKRCIGYFQLDPAYLGYKNGHINLSKKHQVRVADRYASTRYGDWINAKQFWETHHWY